MTSPEEYLKRPYARRLVPDEDGGYVASIQEFPGCIAEGDTANTALANLESAATSWIEAALDLGQVIPEPVESYGYSGKVVLRMPRGLHKRAAELAAVEAASLNQLLVTAVASYVGAKTAMAANVRTAHFPQWLGLCNGMVVTANTNRISNSPEHVDILDAEFATGGDTRFPLLLINQENKVRNRHV